MDWDQLLARGETQNLDFKAAMAWEGDARADLARDIVAMSNIRDGGTIVIGVCEDENGRHIPEGCSVEDLASYDPTKVCDFVAQSFQPGVRIAIEKPEVHGKNLVVLRVREFDTMPSICIKDGPPRRGADPAKRVFYAGNLIVRTSAAKSEAIRTAEDMRALLRHALAKTADTLLTDVRRVVEARPRSAEAAANEARPKEMALWTSARTPWRSDFPKAGSFGVHLLPTQANPARLGHEKMRQLVRAAAVSAPRIGFTQPLCEDKFTTIQNRVGAVQGRVDIGPHQELWQLHASGAFMYEAILHEDLDEGLAERAGVDKGDRFVDQARIAWRVALGALFATRLYSEMLPDAEVDVAFILDHVSGRRLTSAETHRQLRVEYRTAEDQIRVERRTSTLDLRSGWRDLARDVTRELYSLFNYTRLVWNFFDYDLALAVGRE